MSAWWRSRPRRTEQGTPGSLADHDPRTAIAAQPTDAGETLIEVLLTIMIIGLTFTALFSSLSGAGAAGNAQRTSVQADVVMRNYAEATKAAAESCVAGGSYTIAPPASLPPRFTVVPTVGGAPGVVGASGVVLPCPPVATPQLVLLTLTTPSGSLLKMQIKVSTP